MSPRQVSTMSQPVPRGPPLGEISAIELAPADVEITSKLAVQRQRLPAN